MDTLVGVIKGTDSSSSFDELIKITRFDESLLEQFQKTGKDKEAFSIVIKPNMMVFVNKKEHTAVVTSKDMVEQLVDHIIKLGFSNISVCEADNDVGRLLKNHNVAFVANQIGYNPQGRYKIINLTQEIRSYKYEYVNEKGKTKKWKDNVGKTWRDADFRISFAKCKTHEHDWMTLCQKNVYGCFPSKNKMEKYHMKSEIWIATGRSIRNFPVHFAFVDAWIASDGFQGYKFPHPRTLKMLFGGNGAVAVDMEVFKRAGLDLYKSKFIKNSVEQIYNNEYPKYTVVGDTDTHFKQIGPWNNIDDKVVAEIDKLEEVYVAWGFINLRPVAAYVDFSLFPPSSIWIKFYVSLSKGLYRIFLLFKWYRKLYRLKKA
jgi:uncharacterized protein (DUF362 family)